MSTSPGVNVLRWSALLFGVFYGFTHQRSLNTHAAAAQVKADYKHKEDLIQKAKLEWKKKTTPQDQKTAGGDIITDPNDKNFDLEKYITKIEADGI